MFATTASSLYDSVSVYFFFLSEIFFLRVKIEEQGKDAVQSFNPDSCSIYVFDGLRSWNSPRNIDELVPIPVGGVWKDGLCRPVREASKIVFCECCALRTVKRC